MSYYNRLLRTYIDELFERKKYPDKSIYAKTKSLSNITDVLIHRINTYEDLFFLKSVSNIIDFRNHILFIPCMFQQQHDRKFSYDESFELKNICDFINSLNFKNVAIFHPHSDVTAALIERSIVIDNTEFINKVLFGILNKEKSVIENTVLMSTDAGGFKPLMKLCDNLKWEGETYSASKSRKFEENKSTLTQLLDKKDFQGKDVLIIDDLCVYGGTFIGIANMLKSKNIGNLYLAVSHITVQNPNKELENSFKQIFTTNSKYTEYNLSNLTIIDLF